MYAIHKFSLMQGMSHYQDTSMERALSNYIPPMFLAIIITSTNQMPELKKKTIIGKINQKVYFKYIFI